MRFRLLAAAFILGLLAGPGLSAVAPPTKAEQAEIDRIQALLKNIKPQQGTIVLPGGIAQVALPSDYRYLNPKDAGVILTDLWQNPGGASHLGLIYRQGFSPFDSKSWAVIIDYTEDGHIKDDDAAGIDYPKLLAQMKAAAAKESEARTKQGYTPFELVGWAEAPRYDAQSHKLFWAKDLKFQTPGPSPDTLNYNIRILGRKGVLNLNVVASMAQLADVQRAAPTLIGMVNFKPGNRYADFDSSTDKVATYGLAALVAGGIAAKAGLFKLLIAGLLAAKKFVLLALAAAAGYLRKLFGRKKAPNPTTTLTPPSGGG